MPEARYPFHFDKPACEWRKNGELRHLTVGDDTMAGLVEPVEQFRAVYNGRDIGLFPHRWQAMKAVTDAAGANFFVKEPA